MPDTEQSRLLVERILIPSLMLMVGIAGTSIWSQTSVVAVLDTRLGTVERTILEIKQNMATRDLTSSELRNIDDRIGRLESRVEFLEADYREQRMIAP